MSPRARNAVAAVVSMFFLTVYGTVNLVAAFEALSGDPSWRPGLRVHWSVSLLGGVGCLVVMFLIAPLAALVALVLELLLRAGGRACSKELLLNGSSDGRREVGDETVRTHVRNLRRKLIEAGARLFGELGYHATSSKKIARAAGAGPNSASDIDALLAQISGRQSVCQGQL